jgi:hypothetical protein
VSGNDENVLNILEEWSLKDSNYSNDTSVRKRIETFEPSGGITAGTFIYILKREAISKYLIDKIRMYIGAEFNFTDTFADVYTTPFPMDYSLIHENKELMRAFYYSKHQASGVQLFIRMIDGNLIYSENEKRFYYFNGNRWIESMGIMQILFTVLLHSGQRFYSDYSKENDADSAEILTSYVNNLGSLTLLAKFEGAIKQHTEVAHRSIEWDAPNLEATLTLKDCVMDFKGKGHILFRQGQREDENFRKFLKDVFPDAETRKTATYALATMLSGTGKFRKFQIWNGAGNNGKSTLMELMKEIIGERAISYKADVLLTKKMSSSLTPELATFRGALVAFASETDENKRVSQGAVKELTGNETMAANPKYQGIIEFKTTFQLVLSTNYLPTFSAHDGALLFLHMMEHLLTGY